MTYSAMPTRFTPILSTAEYLRINQTDHIGVMGLEYMFRRSTRSLLKLSSEENLTSSPLLLTNWTTSSAVSYMSVSGSVC